MLDFSRVQNYYIACGYTDIDVRQIDRHRLPVFFPGDNAITTVIQPPADIVILIIHCLLQNVEKRLKMKIAKVKAGTKIPELSANGVQSVHQFFMLPDCGDCLDEGFLCQHEQYTSIPYGSKAA